MKKLLLIFLFMSVFVNAQYEGGSVDKGLTYYKYLFKKELNYNGSVFTAKFIAKEWENLFENNADGFKKEFSGATSKLDNLLNSEKFERIAPHIRAFAIHYSKDSGYSPHCGNDDIDEE